MFPFGFTRIMTTELIALLVLGCLGVAAAWTPYMVADYFRARSVTHVDVVACSRQDQLSLLAHIVAFDPLMFSRSVGYLDDSIFTSDRLGIFVDTTCDRTRDMLSEGSHQWSNGWFDRNQTWLFWDPEGSFTTTLLTPTLGTFSDVVVGKPAGLIRLKKTWRSLPVEESPAGFWANETHPMRLISTCEKLDFRQAVVRGTITWLQLIYDDLEDHARLRRELLDPFYKPGFDIINRFYHAIVILLSEFYNYKLEYHIMDSWGHKGENGRWTGMLGMLQRDEADLAVTPMVPVPCRVEVSSPTLSLAAYWNAVVFRQPRALGTYRAMTLELSSEAWACVIGLVLAGAVVFSIVERYEPFPDADKDGSWSMGIVQSVGIIASQGLCLVPQGTSSRIVSFSLLMVSLIVTTYYNAASLHALLSPAPPVIKDLDQLLHSMIPINFRNITIIQQIEVRKRLFPEKVVKVMDQPNLKLWELHEGTRTILNGSAFLDEYFSVFLSINEQFKSDMICDLTVFDAGRFASALGFVKKNPQFKEIHLRGLMRLMEHGLIRKARQTWITEKLNCVHTTQFIHVSLEAVSVALSLFLAGFMLSLTIFLFEMVVSNQKSRKPASHQTDQYLPT